jgi:hypothetical protein
VSHPIRTEVINVWCAPEGQDTPRWLAKFGIGRVYPIFFEGETEANVRAKAEAFRADVIARNETAYDERMARIAIDRARPRARKVRKG